MGRFRSKSKKRLRREKIVTLILVLLSLYFIYSFSKNRIIKSEDTIKNIAYVYMGLKPINKKEVPTKDEVVSLTTREPIIYIYNTHQTENYSFNKLSSYNLDYNVYFASQILSSYFDGYAIVETSSIGDILNNNGFNYSDSYKASRILLEQRVVDYPTLTYFIDLHRDSASYEVTTCEFDNKKYAKIMFILGLENNNYQENEELMNKLNDKLLNINECLSRGILKKEGPYVNGIYNQDFSGNNILIEVGGQYNSIDEVNNTLELFSSIYMETIGVSL